MREVTFIEKEFYHVYNRGVDKRLLFKNKSDLNRFFNGMKEFNTQEIVGHLSRRLPETTNKQKNPLVKFIAYCLNPNHFHFILEQVAEKGIERFMHRLGMGYAKYFNLKYKRSGALFQGRFKALHINSNEYLLHLSVYVNLNDRAHVRNNKGLDMSKSSWDEYTGNISKGVCEKNIILEQFKNKTDYRKFAQDTLKSVVDRKLLKRELEDNFVSSPGDDRRRQE